MLTARFSVYAKTRGVVFVATLVVLVCTSKLPDDVLAAYLATGDYGSRRIASSFRGAELDRVRDLVRGSLPPGVPVDPSAAAAALDPTPSGRALWFQRFAETLYPQPVVVGSQNSIRALPSVAVVGPDVRHGPQPPADETLRLDVIGLLAAVSGLVGIGFAAQRFFRDGLPGVEAAFLRASVLCGVVAAMATWTQLPIPLRWIPVLGLVAIPLVVRGSAWSFRGSIFGFLLLALLLLLVLTEPLSLWDGRSIWLFKAKQLHFNGHLKLADLSSEALAFSHPDYPLLWPSLLATFSGISGAWNERMALCAAPVFFIACVGVVGRIGSPIIGAAGVAAMATMAVFGAGHIALGAYADAFVALLLLGGALAILRPETSDAAWLCLGAAALTKMEGLVFGAILGGVGLCWGTLGLRGAWLMLPGFANVAFSRLLGLPSDYTALDAHAVVTDLLARTKTVAVALGELLRTGGYHRVHGSVIVGFIAWPLSVALLLGRHRPTDALFLTLTAFLAFVAVAAMLVVSPMDLRFLVSTAADRLLLTPALLSLAAVFAALPMDLVFASKDAVTVVPAPGANPATSTGGVGDAAGSSAERP